MLKSLFDSLRQMGVQTGGASSKSSGDPPEPGDVYSFRTLPFFPNFSPPYTGRYAALKIIGVAEEMLVIAVYDGIWMDHPTLSDFRESHILEQKRLKYGERHAIFGTQRKWWKASELDELRLIGFARLTERELIEGKKVLSHAIGTSFSAPYFANYMAEGEWRWRHDREAFEAEGKQNEARNLAERKAQEERYKNRLSKLTWDQLLAEMPFEHWSPSPPFPPVEFTATARVKIQDACRELQALGPKPRKADARRILKTCVTWFNQADEEAGGVIETEEREDICAVLEEMAFVAKHKSLIEEVDEWREW